MFLMGIFWYHLYDMSNYKLCNLDTYNHNFGSSVDSMINSVHRFLLFIPNPNFLLYSCNSFIIIWFLRNFRYQFRIGNLTILTDNHYRTRQ